MTAWAVAGRVLLSLLPAAVLAISWSSRDGAGGAQLLAMVLYWVMPVVLVAWLAAATSRLRAARGGRAAWWRQHAPGLAAAAAATALVFLTVPCAMRVQFDESSLLGTARGMHEGRTAMMPTGAVPGGDAPWVVEQNLDKRPPMFAFLVSVVHDVAGYRPANAFAVNAVVLFLLLAFVAVRARWHVGVLGALAAPCLGLGVPLVAACATSAGFDLLALLLLAVVLAAAIDFQREPTACRATWLLANGLVYAQARYEAVLVLMVVGALLACGGRRWPRDRVGNALLLLSPALLAPIVLLLLHGRDRDFYFEAGGRDLWSFAYFVDHAKALPAAWGSFAADNPFPGPLGVVTLVAFVCWLWRRRGGFATALVVLPVLAVTVMVLAWFYGDVGERSASRLFLPCALLGAIGPLLLLGLWPRRWLALTVLVAAAVWAAWRVHSVADGRVLPRRSPAVVLDAVDLALANLRLDARRTVLVSTVAQYLIVRGMPALPPVAYEKHARGLAAAGIDVVVLETPLDPQLAPQVGDPKGLLRSARVVGLGRVEGGIPVTAWRLAH